MKLVCIAPDDLSALIFCKTLTRLAGDRTGTVVVTVGGRVEGQDEEAYKGEVAAGLPPGHARITSVRGLSPLRDGVYCWRLYRLLRRERPDALVTFTTKPNIFGQLAGFAAQVPVRVMAVRGLGRAFSPSAGSGTRGLIGGLYRVCAALCHRVWFTNPADLEAFVGSGACRREKAFLTKNAVDTADFSPEAADPKRLDALRRELGLTPTDAVVLMVGRLLREKGVAEYLEAAKRLRDRRPELVFVLVAPDESGAGMIPSAAVKEAERQTRLKWVGFRKDVRDFYALASMAALPSYYKEGGYPRALLEPMAFGKPVIAADTPDCRGPVDHGVNGLLVEPRSPQALADAVEKLAADPVLRARMGERALEKVRREFDDRAVFERVLDEIVAPLVARA